LPFQVLPRVGPSPVSRLSGTLFRGLLEVERPSRAKPDLRYSPDRDPDTRKSARGEPGPLIGHSVLQAVTTSGMRFDDWRMVWRTGRDFKRRGARPEL
jgi:hypothetical protein